MTTPKNDTARRMRAGRKGRREFDKRTAGQPRDSKDTKKILRALAVLHGDGRDDRR